MSIFDMLNKHFTDVKFYFGLLLLLTFFLVKKFKQKLNPNVPSTVPGPPYLPVIGHGHQFITHGIGFINLFAEWARKYGDICKIHVFGTWKDIVLINNAAMVQKVLSSPDHLSRPAIIYRKMFQHSDLLLYGLTILDVDTWKKHRTFLNKSFTYHSLPIYIPILNQYAKSLVADVHTEILNNENSNDISLDMVFQLAANRIIQKITLGDVAHSEENAAKVVFENMERGKKIFTRIMMQPWVMLKPICYFHPLCKELTNYLIESEKYFYTIFNKQRKSYELRLTKKRVSGVNEESSAKFQSVMESLFESGLSEKEIISECATIILGGHETISISMTYLMLNLALNPESQRLCQEEIDELFERKEFEELTINSFQHLKYLERCIKESLRIYPPFPFMARESENTSIKLGDNLTIGPKVLFFICPWTIHHNPEYYPNPEKFDPGRFLPENVQKRSSYAYIPFSAGSRNCIGWKLAMMEMLILSAWFLREFEVSIPMGFKIEDLKFNYAITLVSEPNVKFIVRKRSTR